MEKRDLIKSMVSQYFVIFTGTLFALFIYCNVFYPSVTIDLHYLAQLMLFSLLGDLPLLVFYSKRELTEKEYCVRFILHFVLLSIVLMITAYFLEMYSNLLEAVCFFLMIILVYFLVLFVDFRINQATAVSINQRLDEINTDHRD